MQEPLLIRRPLIRTLNGDTHYWAGFDVLQLLADLGLPVELAATQPQLGRGVVAGQKSVRQRRSKRHPYESSASANLGANPTLSQNVSPNKRSPAQWFMYLLQLNRQGAGCLPHYLGLGRFEFDGVILTLGTGADGLSEMQVNERAQLRQELLELRETEWQELQALLAHFCANAEVKMLHLDAIVAAGCLGGDHLWRDMGFTRRAELSDFMQQNFPALAALNSQDMKWKKFYTNNYVSRVAAMYAERPVVNNAPPLAIVLAVKSNMNL